MILQSLVSYYEILAKKGEIPRSGWSKVRVQYALEINLEGRLLSVLPLENVNAKGKPIPRYFEMPAPVKRSVNYDSNFLWDNSSYLLGVDGKGKPERSAKCFENAKALHLQLLGDNDDVFAKAICNFFSTWLPSESANNETLALHLDEILGGANLTFMLSGGFPQSVQALSDSWQTYYNRSSAADKPENKMRCLVTGEKTIPETVHPAIMKVRGAQSSGAALVSFNAPAFESYNREQNLNAPVSKYAAFAYTTALNHLLADSEHAKLIGDTTVVYWAESAEVQYQDAFGCFIDGNSITDNDLNSIMEALSHGKNVDISGLPLNPDNQFYVLGISPNAARLSVRFFLQNSFGDFVRNLKQHYDRLEIDRPDFDKDEFIPLWKLLRETVNPNARDKSASPQMSGDTVRAILTGSRYPATLYQQTMLRIKAEHDINRGKAAIIKAYLIRNSNEKSSKEALTVELNQNTTYQPYVLGRMFSVLEAIQQKANPGLNTTIKDKYFTSACATPSVVFPTLMNLAEKHLRKMDDGSRIWYSKQLLTLFAMINENYPVHLTLSDQGIFQLGYYHQTQKRYEKKNTEKNEEDK